MHYKPSLLRQAWNLLRGRDRLENKDGTLTTKFGARIVPYRITVSRNGLSMSANVHEFCFQPRAYELQEQMKPLLTARPGATIALDERSGKFFLQSTLDGDGMVCRIALGQIDPALEKSLFERARQMTIMRRISGNASPDNPVASISHFQDSSPRETRQLYQATRIASDRYDRHP